MVIRSESDSGRKFAPGDDRQDAAVRISASQRQHRLIPPVPLTPPNIGILEAANESRRVIMDCGPDHFRAACRMGLEGPVSKRRDRPYQAGRSKHWVKVKNRTHPAMSRVMEAL